MEDAQATSPETEVQTPPSQDAPSGSPGFRERGSARRRARFLRKARELAYRDLGGLVYNLHRFGQRNDALVLAKLSTLGQIDSELRTLEGALAEHQPLTVLRDAGIAACPRCAAIHGSEDRFCPNCGLAMDRRAERPVAGPPTSATPAPAPAATPTAAPPDPPARAPAPTPAATTPADPPPAAAATSPPPAAPTPVDYTTIGRPAPAPQTPAPTSSTPAPGAPAAAPADRDQPTVIVRPPGPGA
jgi:cell division septation protein DedD